MTEEEFAAIPAEETAGSTPSHLHPRVSVLMITRNHASFITQAIESVMSQEWPFDYELIIGDDCSDDGTAALCRAFQAAHPHRIRIVHSPDRVGMHRNLARIWYRARGEYVALLEGDDYWTHPAKIATQVSRLDARPDVTLCGTYTQKIRAGASGEWIDSGIVGPAVLKEQYELPDLIPAYSFHTSSVVLRKSVVQFPDWFWDVYCADRPLYLLCAERGPAILLPEVMSVYRLHEAGVWSATDALHKAREGIDLFERLDRHFGYRFEALIRRTIRGILWSYIAEEMNNGRLTTAKRLFRLAANYRTPRAPWGERRATLGTWLRLYAPRAYRALRVLRKGAAVT
jgi:glycosyltransferase involved in cell wall biosynthesis